MGYEIVKAKIVNYSYNVHLTIKDISYATDSKDVLLRHVWWKECYKNVSSNNCALFFVRAQSL